MKTYFGFESCRQVERATITIGSFDGLHRNHRLLLERVYEVSRESNGEILLVTFGPAPSEQNVLHINTLSQRLDFFKSNGVDHVLVIPFDPIYKSAAGKLNILRSILPVVDVHKVIFGKEENSMRELIALPARELGASMPVNFEEFSDAYAYSGELTEQVLEQLDSGNVEAANKLLGYSFELCGDISGRILFDRDKKTVQSAIAPELNSQALPSEGCYEVIVVHSGKPYPGQVMVEERSNNERIVRFVMEEFNDSRLDARICIRFIRNLNSRDCIK